MQRFDELVADADVVVSLLPPPFHPQVASRCIAMGTHLVTASYVSPEMAALGPAAKEAGVIILNEMGLDPGWDLKGTPQVLGIMSTFVTTFYTLEVLVLLCATLSLIIWHRNGSHECNEAHR